MKDSVRIADRDDQRSKVTKNAEKTEYTVIKHVRIADLKLK